MFETLKNIPQGYPRKPPSGIPEEIYSNIIGRITGIIGVAFPDGTRGSLTQIFWSNPWMKRREIPVEEIPEGENFM